MNVIIKIIKLYLMFRMIIVNSCIFIYLFFFWVDFFLRYIQMIVRVLVVIVSGIVILRIISNVD